MRAPAASGRNGLPEMLTLGMQPYRPWKAQEPLPPCAVITSFHSGKAESGQDPLLRNHSRPVRPTKVCFRNLRKHPLHARRQIARDKGVAGCAFLPLSSGSEFGVPRSDMAVIDFWYFIGSTYSYLTVMRLAEVEKASELMFRWRPFNVPHVMVEQNNVPFKNKPVKAAYMWHDIERRAGRYGLAPRVPAPYPLPGLVLANEVATLGLEEGWLGEYTRATYRRWFEDGDPAGEEPNLSASLKEIDQDPDRVLPAAQSERIEQALAQATDEAMELGIFGSPTFVVGGEVF